jgi:predicted amidohydrolase
MRIACVQMDVHLGETTVNIDVVLRHLELLAAQGVQLVLFPECALTGYAVGSLEAAWAIAIESRDELRPIGELCQRHNISAVVGYALQSDGKIYNSATLFMPTEGPYHYSKTHLPVLGLDRFTTPGDALPLFETALGRIGILICYDQRLPEPARTLALKGADLIVLPTNWPDGANIAADYISVARAAENRVFYATCNRVGNENGFHFIGHSRIIDPDGRIVADAGESEGVIIADIDLMRARHKQRIVIEGEYETNEFTTRRPDLYRTSDQTGP